MYSKLLLAFVAAAPLLLGCGDPATDGAGGAGGAGGASSSTETVELTPDAGGTFSDQESGVSLVVPAGAVAENVTVSLTITAKTADTVSSVFRFSPEDTVFELPATLTIEVTDVSVPVGMQLAIAQQVDGAWSALEGSEQGSGGVITPLTNLGSFAAVLVESPAESLCEQSCLSQPGAICCTTCGCGGSGSCTPVCNDPYVWDCELECCFDYEALTCAP